MGEDGWEPELCLAAAASSSAFSAVWEAWTTPVGLLQADLSAQESHVPQVTPMGPPTIFLLICLRQFPAVQKSHLLELGADFVERERTCLYVYVHTRSGVESGIFLSSSPPQFLKHRLSLNLELTDSAKLDWPANPKDPASTFPELTRMTGLCAAFLHGCWGPNSSSQQALNQLSHLLIISHCLLIL